MIGLEKRTTVLSLCSSDLVYGFVSSNVACRLRKDEILLYFALDVKTNFMFSLFMAFSLGEGFGSISSGRDSLFVSVEPCSLPLLSKDTFLP